MVRYIIIASILCLSYNTSWAQNGKELTFITTHNPLEIPDKKEDLSFSFKESNETKMLLLGMIRFYQHFVSSQQNNEATCIFTPSCSRFGYESIKKYGPFHGVLMTSDRLQRCNSFGKKYYTFHPETDKYYDPVEYYYNKIYK